MGGEGRDGLGWGNRRAGVLTYLFDMHRVKRVFTLCSSVWYDMIRYDMICKACSANGGVGIWNGGMGEGGDQMSQDLKNEERARGAREGVNKETDTF